MKTSQNRQTNEQRLDPNSQAYVDEMRNRAKQQYETLQGFQNPYGGSFSPEISQYLTSAGGGFQGGADAGALGLRVLSGDRGALDQMLNPFLNELDPAFAKSAQLALRTAGDQATQQGAFGSRSDILKGTLLSNVANARAGARVQAVNDAYGRAGQLANLGMGANAGLAGIGQYMTDSDRNTLMMKYQDFLRQQGIPQQLIGLLAGGMGPYGQTNTQTTETQSSPLGQLAGLGLTLFGPGGMLAGKGAGAAAGAAAPTLSQQTGVLPPCIFSGDC